MQFYAFEVSFVHTACRLIPTFALPQIARNRLGLNDGAHEIAKQEAVKEKAKKEKEKEKAKKKTNGK